MDAFERAHGLVGMVRGEGLETRAAARASATTDGVRGRYAILGRYAEVHSADGRYDVWMIDDQLRVEHGPEQFRVTVPDYGTAFGELIERETLRVALGRFPSGERVLYVYDADDDNFGYAMNLDWPDESEWGYAPVENAR